jgi:hypothetical protein
VGRTEEQLDGVIAEAELNETMSQPAPFGRIFRDRFGGDRNWVRPPRRSEVNQSLLDTIPTERRIHLGQSMRASLEELRALGLRLSDHFARDTFNDLLEELEGSLTLYETAASRSEIELAALRNSVRRLEDRYRAERARDGVPQSMPREAPIGEALERAAHSVESLVGSAQTMGDAVRTSAFRVVESVAQIRRILVDLVRSDVRILSAELHSPIGQSVVAVRRSEMSSRQDGTEGVAYVGSSLKLPPPGAGTDAQSLKRSLIDQGAFAWTIEVRYA